MWVLVIVVWTLSNGQMQENTYLAEQQYSSVEDCARRGAEVVNTFTDRVRGIAGAGYVCGLQQPDPPRRGEYDT